MHAPRMTFTFEKCLGQGGFGEVYLARLNRSGGLEKKVAVKVLKDDLRNTDEAVQRLRDEGRMLAILDHPCIVRVLEMTLIQGRVALVTEYIDGIDLARCCKAPRLLPHKVLVGVVGEVASGLHCAWTTPSPETGKALKLIHRDVKPENIRIGKHGEVKLLDFGIARTTEMYRHAKTAQGDLPFTPGYAAPEAFTKGFQGSSSDVYALGVSLYRLLAGERFYEGMDLSAQVATCCLHERYAPFLRRRLAKLDVHPDLLALLKQMLAYEAVDRPPAQEVESRCVAICDALDGPTHVRWARGVEFPEPAGLEGGSLTGLTLQEDTLDASRPTTPRGVRLGPKADSGEALLKQTTKNPPRASSPSVVTDLTPPMRVPQSQPPSPNRTDTPSRSSMPPPEAPLPPLPPLLASSVKPVTGRITLADYHQHTSPPFAEPQYTEPQDFRAQDGSLEATPSVADVDLDATQHMNGNMRTLDGFMLSEVVTEKHSLREMGAQIEGVDGTDADAPPLREGRTGRGSPTVDPAGFDTPQAPSRRASLPQVDLSTPAPASRQPAPVPVSSGIGSYLVFALVAFLLCGLLLMLLLVGGLLLGVALSAV